MRNRNLILALLALLIAAGTAWAADPVNNAINATATSATWTFDVALDESGYGYSAFWFKVDGANPVYVCPWRRGETVVACTTGSGRKLLAGEAKSWGAEPTNQNPIPRPLPRARRFGFIAVSYICAAGQTSSGNRAEAWQPY